MVRSACASGSFTLSDACAGSKPNRRTVNSYVPGDQFVDGKTTVGGRERLNTFVEQHHCKGDGISTAAVENPTTNDRVASLGESALPGQREENAKHRSNTHDSRSALCSSLHSPSFERTRLQKDDTENI